MARLSTTTVARSASGVDRDEMLTVLHAFEAVGFEYVPIEETNTAPVLTGPCDGFERFFRHCVRYGSVAPGTYPRGVFRFQSLEEAQRARRRAHVPPAGDPQPDSGLPE